MKHSWSLNMPSLFLSSLFPDNVHWLKCGLLSSGMSRPTDRRAVCDKCLTVQRVGESVVTNDSGDDFPKQQQVCWEERSHVQASIR